MPEFEVIPVDIEVEVPDAGAVRLRMLMPLKYFVLDDCYQLRRDSRGNPLAKDTARGYAVGYAQRMRGPLKWGDCPFDHEDLQRAWNHGVGAAENELAWPPEEQI